MLKAELKLLKSISIPWKVIKFILVVIILRFLVIKIVKKRNQFKIIEMSVTWK